MRVFCIEIQFRVGRRGPVQVLVHAARVECRDPLDPDGRHPFLVMETAVVRVDRHGQVPYPHPGLRVIRGRFRTLQPDRVAGRFIEAQKSLQTQHAGFLVRDIGIVARPSGVVSLFTEVLPDVFRGADRRSAVPGVARRFSHPHQHRHRAVTRGSCRFRDRVASGFPQPGKGTVFPLLRQQPIRVLPDPVQPFGMLPSQAAFALVRGHQHGHVFRRVPQPGGEPLLSVARPGLASGQVVTGRLERHGRERPDHGFNNRKADPPHLPAAAGGIAIALPQEQVGALDVFAHEAHRGHGPVPLGRGRVEHGDRERNRGSAVYRPGLIGQVVGQNAAHPFDVDGIDRGLQGAPRPSPGVPRQIAERLVPPEPEARLITVRDAGFDRMKPPYPSFLSAGTERIQVHRARELKPDLDGMIVFLPRSDGSELKSGIGHDVFRELRLFDGRFAPRRGIEHGYGETAVETEREQGRGKHVLAQQEPPVRVVSRAARRALPVE